MSKLTKLLLVIMIIGILSFSSFVGTEIFLETRFKKDCSNYIELAARSTTVELAKENLAKAISFAEEHNLTSGNSSIYIKYPNNDIGFWYKNLIETYNSLETLDENSTLETSNVLMKLECLTTQTADGIEAICPSNIYEYPYHMLIFWWGIFSIVLLPISILAFLSKFSTE